jgi:hypothetical protein
MPPWREAVETLCKWRGVLAAWHLGEIGRHAPGVPAMRDLQESRLVTRVELSALMRVLIAKGIVTESEVQTQMGVEAWLLDQLYQTKFPGYRAVPEGVEMNLAVAEETRRVLGFPPP